MSHHILLCEAIENVGEDDAIIVIPPDMSDEEQENGEPASELEICNEAEIGEETVLPNETASESVWGKMSCQSYFRKQNEFHHLMKPTQC